MQKTTYRFLQTERDISEYLRSLCSEGLVAIDLEADSLYSYQEKICLVQVSTSKANTIVDPLPARKALEGLGTVLADPAVEKVFHGGDYDFRLLKKDYGFSVRNAFDTAIAAQFTGRTRFGLAALLAEFFDVEVDKKYQRANWSARPLKAELLAYAALDTAYLPSLRARLREELRTLGRLEWAEEEFALLETVTPAPPKPPSCLNVKGACRLPPRQLAFLQALLEMRDTAAREWDRPPFKVLPTSALLSWTRTPPSTRREIVETPGAGKGVLARLAEPILEALQTAAALPLSRCPRPKVKPHETLKPAQAKRLASLKRARDEAVERLQLPAGLLVNTATLERLARTEPTEAADGLGAHLKNWQLEAVGQDLTSALLA